jgi:hypothetical protein
MVTQSTQATRPLHVFEVAGLGKAPFEYVGSGIGRTSCDYCGTAIVNQFFVASADGKQFVVGCECIKKTDDANLVRPVSRALRDMSRARQYERNTSPAAQLRRRCEEIILRYADQLERIPAAAIPSAGPPTLLTWSRLMLKVGVLADLERKLETALGLSKIR